MIPGMWLASMQQLQKRWFCIMRITHVPAINNTLSMVLQIFISWLFVFVFDLGIVGLGWALCLTQVIINCCLLIHTCLLPQIKEAVFFFTWDTFTGLRQMIQIGTLMIVFTLSFVMALELRLYMAGSLGNAEIAATATLVNIAYAVQNIALGIQTTSVSVFGNLLGENQPELAWKIFRINSALWIAVYALIAIVMIALRGRR
jgi:Na+-driven multidrug efflux pump